MEVRRILMLTVAIVFCGEARAQLGGDINCSQVMQLVGNKHYHRVQLLPKFPLKILFAAVTSDDNIWLAKPPDGRPQLLDVLNQKLSPEVGTEAATSITLDPEDNMYYSTASLIYKYNVMTTKTSVVYTHGADQILIVGKTLYARALRAVIKSMSFKDRILKDFFSSAEINGSPIDEFVVTKELDLYLFSGEDGVLFYRKINKTSERIELPKECTLFVGLSWLESAKALFIVCDVGIYYITKTDQVAKKVDALRNVAFLHINPRKGDFITQEAEGAVVSLYMYVSYNGDPCRQRKTAPSVTSTLTLIPMLLAGLAMIASGVVVVVATLFFPYRDQTFDLQDTDVN